MTTTGNPPYFRRQPVLLTGATSCFQDGAASTRMQRVPADAWFQDFRYRKRMEVHEQSMKLGNYSTVLTLLWVLED